MNASHTAFSRRHIGTDAAAQATMLAELGHASMADLMDAAVPASIRLAPGASGLPAAATEREAIAELRALAGRNRVRRAMIGLGYYPTVTPAVIQRNVLENPSWYTAYTPYQPEISQGRLEALINFQTMIEDLTGLAVASSSLLDEATAVAEAMLDEILSKSYQNDAADANNSSATLGCTPTTVPRCQTNTVTDRQNYNDVDDYNGWNQVGVFQLDGTPVPGLGNYTVSVGVVALNLSGVAGKQINVTVVGGAETIALAGFRANF